MKGTVGKNNNLGRMRGGDAEYQYRNAANLVWLRQAFDLARREGSRAIALIIHANPLLESGLTPLLKKTRQTTPTSKNPPGYGGFLAALGNETLAFAKPVVLLHGDTHHFRIDKPMFARVGKRRRVIENFTRIESFGCPDAHWVCIIVDPNDPNVFTFKQKIVRENIVCRRGQRSAPASPRWDWTL